MPERHPLLQRPAWAPRWVPSIDDTDRIQVLRWCLIAVFAAGLAACVVESANSPADPELGASPASALAARFGTVLVEIVTGAGDVIELCLLDADDPEERSRGLMEVTDLEGHDGMLFRNDAPVENRFVMIDTVLPLSITWWHEDGSFVSATDMTPCTEEDPDACPRYPAAGPYREAIEVPQGALADAGIDESSRLLVGDRGCAPA